ncbi:hypothetical protein [Paenibacillus sp. MMS18-CY102]|uniref:hypothetical protein n=1 Tax=Paenibacillus sp. MMS18-CY102 TaxID=2682849 RepID=UPI0013656C91|nr:hypothetical protein [Paenibacillus sp. MMS18-CY102]MWC30826.1 hypothetical protein [Paenibacillus sp. MMS18-CY102]
MMLTAVFLGVGCAAFACIYLIDVLSFGIKGMGGIEESGFTFQLGIASCGFFYCLIADRQMRKKQKQSTSGGEDER